MNGCCLHAEGYAAFFIPSTHLDPQLSRITRRDLGSAAETQLFPEPGFQIASDVSPDGSTLLYRRRMSGGSFDIWTMPAAGGGQPTPWLETPFSEIDAKFSPDGRQVAFISDETGSPELYVAPFADPAAKTRISRDGALLMRWPGDREEIVYVAPDGRVMAVSTQPTLRVGTAVLLFTIDPGAIWTTFDVSADGARFLTAVPLARASGQPITVITNWAASPSR